MIEWASTPYDPRWAYAHPRRAGWVSAAGPLANLALVIVAGLAIRLGMSEGWVEPGVANFTQLVVGRGSALFDAAGLSLSILFKLNLLLFVFNLIPVPPLDGSGALALFLPKTPRAACNRCSGGPSSPWWES